MPFLRNEFSKIFEDHFKIKELIEMSHILGLVGCEMLLRKFLKLREIHKSLPTA